MNKLGNYHGWRILHPDPEKSSEELYKLVNELDMKVRRLTKERDILREVINTIIQQLVERAQDGNTETDNHTGLNGSGESRV